MTTPSEVTEVLSRLVAFDTTSRNSNLGLIAFVEEYLFRHGVTSLRVDYEDGRKTNLYATIGPDIAGGIVLSGHTDVVPVDGQKWSSDPFQTVQLNGRIYGRGTADMKGFLAAVMASVPVFTRTRLARPIHLAFSCDEEVGCRGVRPLIDHMIRNLPLPSAVLVGEPSSMQVVDAHKGVNTFRTTVTGHEAHSSCTHQGVNAIMVAGELICEVNRIAEEHRDRGDPSGCFDPPYTTVHIGTISGGTAKNIIPRQCEFNWEARLLPGVSGAEISDRITAFGRALEPAMHAVSRETGIETLCTNDVPGLRPDARSPALSLALSAAEANGTAAVSYCTEAGLFQQAGIPAIICGPGSIEQAHKPDEFIAVGELKKCLKMLERIADYCAAG